MLRQRENSRKTGGNSILQKEADLLNTILVDVAKKQEVSSSIQRILPAKIDFSNSTIDCISIVLLVSDKQKEQVKKLIDWIGLEELIKEPLDFKKTYQNKVSLKDNEQIDVRVLHFDQYSRCYSLENKREVTFIVYDTNYREQYDNWDFAFKVLQDDHTIKFGINLMSENPENSEKKPKKINFSFIENINLEQLQNISILELLSTDDFKKQLYLSGIKNYLNIAKHTHDLIIEDFKVKESQLTGKTILLHKKQEVSQSSNVEISSRELMQLKSKVDKKLKNVLRQVEDDLENFDRDNDDYKELEEDITSFLGFVEHKSNKYITLKISEGAINDKVNKSNIVLKDFFEQLFVDTEQKIKAVEQDIRSWFKEYDMKLPEHIFSQLNQGLTKEIVTYNNLVPDKPYEKQIGYKSISSLIMELRSPLFMLMPFMMIFALFGALVGEEDKGNIDESILFYENRPCIAIDKLPEEKNNQFRKFINDIENYRQPSKAVFSREINNELLTEPQLAVKKEEVQKRYRNRIEYKETLDYYFDSKNQILYVYLMENADRNFVIQKLYDPSLKLLTIPASNRGTIGIGGLIRAMSGLRDYRYIILIALVGLITRFIITRKSSINNELKTSKIKEQNKLNNNLKQHIEKNIKQSFQKWKSKLSEELNTYQNSFLTKAEIEIDDVITRKNKKKQLDNKLIQKRLNNIKTEKSKLSSLKSEHRKLKTKIDQFQLKANKVILSK